MAFKDYDGRITIDEAEAQKDIASIQVSIDLLSESGAALRRLVEKSNELKGRTASAMADKSAELISVIDDRIETLRSAIEYIRYVVARYQALDIEVKNMIQSGGEGGQKNA